MRFLFGFFLLLLFSPVDAADKVRAGFGSLASSHMVMYVAKDFGLFQKYGLRLYSRKPYPSLTGIKAILDSLVLKEERARRGKAEQFVDLSIVKQLDDSGFIDHLYR